MEGRVLLRVAVDEDGLVNGIQVKKSSGHRILDEAALAAVKKWRFFPAAIGGIRVKDTIDLPVVFSLR
jgi:protein TonB